MPLAGIAGVLLYVAVREPPQDEIVVIDKNKEIDDLRSQVGSLKKDYQRVVRLIRTEDASADRATKALADRLHDFMDEFNKVMEPFLDEDGYIKDEYSGYKKIRQPVVQMINDLSKQTGFDLDG